MPPGSDAERLLGGTLMNVSVSFAWIALVAMLVPAVHAGSAGSPELQDASGDVSTPGLDVVSAWWSSAPAPLFVESDVPDTGVSRVDNLLAARHPAGDRLQVTVKLNDLAGAQPLADASTQYQYRISFTPDVLGTEVTIVCVLNYANAAASVGILPYYDRTGDVQRVGLLCGPVEDGTQFKPFHADGSMDLLADTLSVTLVERDVDVTAGTVFSDLRVATQANKVNNGLPLLKVVPGDVTGLGSPYTFGG